MVCHFRVSILFLRDIWLYDQADFVRFNQMLTDINWNEKLCNFDDVDDNKVLVLPLILVGLSITFLRLKIFTRSISLLLYLNTIDLNSDRP
jgi:hypothetical protein